MRNRKITEKVLRSLAESFESIALTGRREELRHPEKAQSRTTVLSHSAEVVQVYD